MLRLPPAMFRSIRGAAVRPAPRQRTPAGDQSPHRGLAEVDLLDADERGRWRLSGRTAEIPADEKPAFMTSSQSTLGPIRRRLALSDGEQRLCYAELDARVGRWHAACARWTCGRRPGRDCLERVRGPGRRAARRTQGGAVYVPMDPAYPAGRLSLHRPTLALRVVIGIARRVPRG